MSSARYIGFLSAALFLAVCAYVGASVFPGAGGAGSAALCEATVTEYAPLRGVAVRHERALGIDAAKLTAEAGLRVAAGEALAVSGDSVVTTDRSAVFFPDCDGFEALSPDGLSSLSVSGLEAILEQKGENSSGGRLVYENEWFFAAVSDSAALPAEGACRVLFESCDEPIDARVVSLSENEGGERVIVLRLTAGGEYLRLRKCSAKLICGEYTGFKAPEEAVERDGDGTFVNILTASGSERAAVDIIYSGDGFCLISPADSDSPVRDGARVTTALPSP